MTSNLNHKNAAKYDKSLLNRQFISFKTTFYILFVKHEQELPLKLKMWVSFFLNKNKKTNRTNIEKCQSVGENQLTNSIYRTKLKKTKILSK